MWVFFLFLTITGIFWHLLLALQNGENYGEYYKYKRDLISHLTLISNMCVVSSYTLNFNLNIDSFAYFIASIETLYETPKYRTHTMFFQDSWKKTMYCFSLGLWCFKYERDSERVKT